MTLATLPTASEIIAESRLRPEQLSRTMTEADLAADVEARINEQRSVVEVRLSALTTPTSSQSTAASLAVKLLTLSSLYLTAGQLKEEYLERSKEYRARGEALLVSLTPIASTPGPATNVAATLTLGRGDYSPLTSDEF